MKPRAVDVVDGTPATPITKLALVCARDVQPESVEWLWTLWLPFGKLVSVDGNAGLGKSTLVTDWIARATRGGPMPMQERRFEPVTVLIAGVEDGWADTVRPRLDAANADTSRVHFVLAPASSRGFTIPADVPELMQRAKEVGARWLHLDAIMGVLSEDVSANSDHEVRRALGPLKEAAEEHDMLVTFVRHPRKSGGLAVHAGGGSVAFTALSRVGLIVGAHPDDGEKPPAEQRRVVAVGKSNLAKHPASLAFTIESAPNGAGCIAWQGTATITADELASPPLPQGRRTEEAAIGQPRKAAADFVLRQLNGGRRVATDALKVAARDAGISWRTVHRAADELGVTKIRDGYQGPGIWYLPTHETLSGSSGATEPPVVPHVPRSAPHGNGGTTGTTEDRWHDSGAGATVVVTMTDGTRVTLPADSPDLQEFPELIARVDPNRMDAAA